MSFGLGPVALNLALAQGNLGQSADVWCLDSEEGRRWGSSTSGLPQDRIRLFDKSWPSILGYSREMERIARSGAINMPRIFHQHGIWTGLSRTTNIVRAHGAVATIITPHGSLKPWALKKSSWKKRIARAMYENDNFCDASCIHAVSEAEVQDLRDFGLINPIAVIPNGIAERWLTSTGDGSGFRDKFGIPSNKRILLFLSRITPVKGLPMLLEAIAGLGNDFSEWMLVIAGGDEFNHKEVVCESITSFGLDDKVIFTGALFDQAKRDAFAAADLFVLPSYSEASPIVILEALAAGIPVVATKASPWGDLEKFQCGWLANIDRDSLTDVLKVAISTERSDLQAMGQRGHDLVVGNYTWQRSAQMSIELYGWLLGFGNKPIFVKTI